MKMRDRRERREKIRACLDRLFMKVCFKNERFLKRAF